MINSMTGFGSKEAGFDSLGKICVELRSSNHKFLETVLHLPEGFLSLEDKIKKEIEAKIKRGRVTCAITIIGARSPKAFINTVVLKEYIVELNKIKKELHLQDAVNINTLINLPGVLAVDENKITKTDILPRLKGVLNQAILELVKTRQKEGRALYGYLKGKAENLAKDLTLVKTRYKSAVQQKSATYKNVEERGSFLKDSDINEEIERLTIHIRNFKDKLSKSGPVGKELDFIAQEMQREANTMAAKLFDASLSVRVVQMKSQIEKIREQVQNIE